LREFRRQALHAAKLAFEHPVSHELVEFEAPLPADFAGLLAALRADVVAAKAAARPRF
jgi:23S rRNA pseudouridine1911/1915/1917 synthase